jgi:hypothetical protein
MNRTPIKQVFGLKDDYVGIELAVVLVRDNGIEMFQIMKNGLLAGQFWSQSKAEHEARQIMHKAYGRFRKSIGEE